MDRNMPLQHGDKVRSLDGYGLLCKDYIYTIDVSWSCLITKKTYVDLKECKNLRKLQGNSIKRFNFIMRLENGQEIDLEDDDV